MLIVSCFFLKDMLPRCLLFLSMYFQWTDTLEDHEHVFRAWRQDSRVPGAHNQMSNAKRLNLIFVSGSQHSHSLCLEPMLLSLDTVHDWHSSATEHNMGADTHPGLISEAGSGDLEFRTTSSWRDSFPRDLDNFCCRVSLRSLLFHLDV